MVTQGHPIIYEPQEYLTISIPTKPAAESLPRRAAAEARRTG